MSAAGVAVCREPCVNGAHCVDVDVCQCRLGYTGNNCEAGCLFVRLFLFTYFSAQGTKFPIGLKY